MNTISYSALREKLASILDRVSEDHSPVIVTRQGREPAVIMSLEDFKSYEETAHLMSSARNSARLNESIEELENGTAQRHDLIIE